VVIDRESRGEVVVLRMARGKVNALDLEMLLALTGALDELAGDGRPLVLTGQGSTFSAGVDLRRLATESSEYVEEYLGALSMAFRAVFGYPGPAVAALNGHAIAGGFVLAAACDHRVAAEGAGTFGLSELAVGVPFPTSAIEIVRHAVGTARAHRLALSAELLDIGAALAAGLLDEVVPPESLVDTAVARAAGRADHGLAAYRLTKRQLQRPANERMDAAAEDGPLVAAEWTDPVSRERIRAFLANLRPH
jgi:enoyl-CoA hydratase